MTVFSKQTKPSIDDHNLDWFVLQGKRIPKLHYKDKSTDMYVVPQKGEPEGHSKGVRYFWQVKLITVISKCSSYVLVHLNAQA